MKKIIATALLAMSVSACIIEQPHPNEAAIISAIEKLIIVEEKLLSMNEHCLEAIKTMPMVVARDHPDCSGDNYMKVVNSGLPIAKGMGKLIEELPEGYSYGDEYKDIDEKWRKVIVKQMELYSFVSKMKSSW